VTVQAEAARTYPNGVIASHVIGYLNQITADELNERREQGYHTGDAIGRSGLERQWEPYLRGQDGRERIIVDAKGQRKLDAEDLVELLGGPQRTEPVPGHDLITTLDLDLQRTAEAALGKHRSAAAAVVEVKTGRVLALASVPAPDPNALSGKLSRTQAEALINDKIGRPLIDKTLRENYFPGSTYKVVPMLAGLEDKLIDPEEIVTCHGALRFGGRWFHCVESHAKVNLHRAIVESCNVYFYGLGDKLGLDRMARVAAELGLGAPTGLGLNGEVPGFVPDMEHYKKAGGFQKGVVLNSAIGQGSVKVTVLQLTMAYAAIASGTLWVPQIVSRIETPSGKVVQEFAPKARRTLSVSQEDLKRVRAALLGAVSDRKGTSYAARIPGFDVAGKTGTAQVGNRRVKDLPEGSPDSDHAWFASFAPARDPQIAVVVLVEHGGFGAKSATPAAMEIYRHYFKLGAKAR
jgi:penicillin-binding protein 2